MNGRSINEQLSEQAERQGLLEPDESRPVSLLMLASVGALDALAVVALLALNPVAGAVLFVVSSVVLSHWLSSPTRVTTREGRRR